MEGVIVLGTAGLALIGVLLWLIFGTVQRLRPAGRKKCVRSPRSSRETLQPPLALEAPHLVPVVDGQDHFRASLERSSPGPPIGGVRRSRSGLRKISPAWACKAGSPRNPNHCAPPVRNHLLAWELTPRLLRPGLTPAIGMTSVITSALCGGANGMPKTPRNASLSLRVSTLRLSGMALSTDFRRLAELTSWARLAQAAAGSSAPH